MSFYDTGNSKVDLFSKKLFCALTCSVLERSPSLGEVLMLVFFGLVFLLEKEDERDKLKVPTTPSV